MTDRSAFSSAPVACFGELLLRLSPPGAQTILQAEALELVVGGAEANVAAALASLGQPARFIGMVPDNPLGHRARATLRAAGVDTRFLTNGPGRMGLYFLETGAGLRPSAITYDRAGSAFALAKPDAFDFARALAGTRLLHISGITPALGLGGLALARAAVAAANAAGVPIVFDGNYRATLWESWDSDPRAMLCELVAEARILFGSHRDIALLLGRPFSGDNATSRREAALAALEAFPKLELVASTTREAITTSYHRIAARVDSRAECHETAAIDIPDIVDRIGTGDAFAAGVLLGWLEGAEPGAIADSGLALAALKHSLPGDMCLMNRAALNSFSPNTGDVRR